MRKPGRMLGEHSDDDRRSPWNVTQFQAIRRGELGGEGWLSSTMVACPLLPDPDRDAPLLTPFTWLQNVLDFRTSLALQIFYQGQ